MTTANAVLNVASHEVGYVEGGGADGRSGNLTKYWAELAPTFQGQPWCAAFQRWVDLHAAAPDLPVAQPYYCPSLVTYARQHGLWDTSGRYAPGDLVFFSWAQDGVAQHIERVVADDGRMMTTIGANTSPDDSGSQANGGGVYQRMRPHGPQVMGVLAYSRLLEQPVAPRNPVKANPYAPAAAACAIGAAGDAVRFVQWAVGVPVDGSFGPQTDHAVQQFQHYHGLVVDGDVGPQTLAALRQVTH